MGRNEEDLLNQHSATLVVISEKARNIAQHLFDNKPVAAYLVTQNLLQILVHEMTTLAIKLEDSDDNPQTDSGTSSDSGSVHGCPDC